MSTFVPPRNDSRNLVTTLAWCFIALSAFGTFISGVETVLFNTVLNDARFNAAFTNANLTKAFPPYMGWFMSHMRLVAAVLLAGSAVTLVASIGLLKRRNWARLVFIVLLALGIVWYLVGTAVQIATFSPLAPPPEIARGMPDFKFLFIGGMIFSAIWSIGMSCLFGWLIKRLVSPDIVAEFRR